MTLAARLNLALIGLILAATTLLWPNFRTIEMPSLLAGIAATAGVILLALVLAHAFGRMTTKLRDNAAAIENEADQRRRAQATLEQYVQRDRVFIAAVESASHPVITTTPDGTITAWNPAAERLYKYPAAEAIGHNIQVIVPADLQDEYAAILERAINDEPIENIESVRLTKDARRIDVAFSLRPVKSSSGATVAVTKIMRDITAQKFAEEKFRLAVESCPSGMVMIDDTGKIVMANTEIERLFGYSRDELMGQPVDILVPERLRDHHVGHRKDFTENPETRRMGAGRDLFGRRKDGTEFPVEVGLNPIHTREGILVLSVVVDITERKQAEEMFRLAVEACPNGMVMIDSSGKMVMVNTEIEQLFGYRREELVGQQVDILVPIRLRSLHKRHRRGFVAAPETRRMGEGRDLFGLRKDGTEFPVEVGLNPIHVGDNLLVLSVIVDISERKRMERLKDEFVSTVSHELRTPLTSIAGSLGLLIGGAAGKLPDPATRLLTIAQTNSQRLVRLINDILDIEKMESGQTVFNFKRVETRSLVEQAIEANRGFADSYKVQIRLDGGTAEGPVHADPDRLSQVVTNLLSNAIKFSPQDDEVVVVVEQHGGMMRISVRDHGPGIPIEFKPHVFEKFAQADATNARQKSGTGLGLSIVQQIVTRLGGTVGFDDAPGGGTIFYVELPGWNQVASREIDLAGSLDSTRILLCEDDPDAAIRLREGLQRFGFRTDFAHNRDEAIAHAAATPYAAILVDFELPEGDGINLIRQLREQPTIYKTPIVVISAVGGINDELASSKLNVLDWVEKPVDPDRLAQILDRIVVGDANSRPLVLHVDDDHDVLDVVAGALGPTANVVSVDSLEEARRVLATQHFDLAVLDITIGPVCGLDLLPELRGRNGDAIPVIVFSAHAATMQPDPQVQVSLNKSQASLDRLLATVHDRLRLRPSHAPMEVV